MLSILVGKISQPIKLLSYYQPKLHESNQNKTNQIKRNYGETQFAFEFLERFKPNVTAEC